MSNVTGKAKQRSSASICIYSSDPFHGSDRTRCIESKNVVGQEDRRGGGTRKISGSEETNRNDRG